MERRFCGLRGGSCCFSLLGSSASGAHPASGGLRCGCFLTSPACSLPSGFDTLPRPIPLKRKSTILGPYFGKMALRRGNTFPKRERGSAGYRQRPCWRVSPPPDSGSFSVETIDTSSPHIWPIADFAQPAPRTTFRRWSTIASKVRQSDLTAPSCLFRQWAVKFLPPCHSEGN